MPRCPKRSKRVPTDKNPRLKSYSVLLEFLHDCYIITLEANIKLDLTKPVKKSDLDVKMIIPGGNVAWISV